MMNYIRLYGYYVKRKKNQYDNVGLYLERHLGFEGHFECFLMIFILVPGTIRFGI